MTRRAEALVMASTLVPVGSGSRMATAFVAFEAVYPDG